MPNDRFHWLQTISDKNHIQATARNVVYKSASLVHHIKARNVFISSDVLKNFHPTLKMIFQIFPSTKRHKKMSLHLPSMNKGLTTSWFKSSKFSCPIQCSIFLFRPVKKLSATVTSCPSSISLSTRCDPTKPAPPVI